jgi:hypothetical protein
MPTARTPVRTALAVLEAARIIGCFSAFLLVAAIAVGVKLFRSRLVQGLAGRRGLNSGQAELGSQLVVLAGSLSAIAAVLAVAGWIVT